MRYINLYRLQSEYTSEKKPPWYRTYLGRVKYCRQIVALYVSLTLSHETDSLGTGLFSPQVGGLCSLQYANNEIIFTPLDIESNKTEWQRGGGVLRAANNRLGTNERPVNAEVCFGQ